LEYLFSGCKSLLYLINSIKSNFKINNKIEYILFIFELYMI
jgi:hypothetical protein